MIGSREVWDIISEIEESLDNVEEDIKKEFKTFETNITKKIKEIEINKDFKSFYNIEESIREMLRYQFNISLSKIIADCFPNH